jgi:hypothetical protein
MKRLHRLFKKYQSPSLQQPQGSRSALLSFNSGIQFTLSCAIALLTLSVLWQNVWLETKTISPKPSDGRTKLSTIDNDCLRLIEQLPGWKGRDNRNHIDLLIPMRYYVEAGMRATDE